MKADLLKRNTIAAVLAAVMCGGAVVPVLADEEGPMFVETEEETAAPYFGAYDDPYTPNAPELPGGEDESKIHKVGQFKYMITGTGTAAIVGWNSPSGTPAHENVSPISGDFTVPSSVVIDGKTYTVNEMMQQLFYSNTNVTSITIPASITTMDADCFSGCTNLKNIYVNSGNRYFSSIDGILYNSSGTKLLAMPAGRTGSYTVSSSTTAIGDYAFLNTRLTTVTLPSSVSVLGSNAFSGAPSLREVKLTSSISAIPTDCFAGSGIYRIDLPESIASIGYGAFTNCPDLNAVSLPSRLTSLPAYAFAGCTALKAVSIPDGIRMIPDSAFMNCEQLGTVELPKNLLSIGSSAFQNCLDLNQIGLPASVTSIGYQAFLGSGLERVILPDSLQTVQGMAFANCPNLKEVYLPKNSASIGQTFGVFMNDDRVNIYGSPADVPEWLEEYASKYTGGFNYNNLPALTKEGWRVVNGYAAYALSDGSLLKNSWKNIAGQNYYFNENGYMQTGWLQLENVWYYFDVDGTIVKNAWVGDDYLGSDGIWIPNKWEKRSGSWYWVYGDGTIAKSQWIKDGAWYYVGADGKMQTGWIDEGNEKYFLANDGSMAASRWVFKDNNWYYFVSSGEMARNRWIQVKGLWYYMTASGAMAADTYIDGWYVDHDGVYIPGK